MNEGIATPSVHYPHQFKRRNFTNNHEKFWKMWRYFCVLFALVVLLLLYMNLTSQNLATNTSIELNIYDTKGDVHSNNENDTAGKNKNNSYRRKFKYHVPKFMLDLYEKSKNLGDDNMERPDIVRSLIPKSTGSFKDDILLEQFDENHLLVFDIPNSKEDEDFLSAELKILTIVKINPKNISGVERVISASIYDETTKNLLHLDKVHVFHTDNTWLTFNVTKPVTKIMKAQLDPKYLRIVILIKNFLPHFKDNLKLSLMPFSEDFEHDYPVLLLSYNSHGLKRAKNRTNRPNKGRFRRNVEEDYEEETNHLWDDDYTKKLSKKIKRARNTCRRKPLYVDFAEIQYDAWIVQPSGYEAYQCQGKCFYPVADHLNPTKHAIVQALLHSVSPARAPRSCCVPTKLDSISVLYVDEIGVLTYRYAYKDMVVVECGCR